MRWVNLFVACAAAGFFCSGIVRAANDSAFQIADWTGRAYLNQKEKRLDRCSAQMTNANNITIIFSLDRHYMWTFELSNPTWNFPKGAAFDVTFGIGNNNYFRQRVSALDAQLVRVLLPDSVNAFEAFRRVLQLELIAGGLTSQFNMAYANQTLDALMKCVMRYGPNSTKSRGRHRMAEISDRSSGRGQRRSGNSEGNIVSRVGDHIRSSTPESIEPETW